MDDVWPDGEADPGVFFGATERSRKTNWKALQLCKQVERAASLTWIGEVEEGRPGARFLAGGEERILAGWEHGDG